MTKLDQLYSNNFYENQVAGSYRSATAYVQYLANFFSPSSVADIGCGRGTWLKAFKDMGVKTLLGFDGDWNTQRNMLDDCIVFTALDLNKPIVGIQKVDLAMSLEVAEHLSPSSAMPFVKSLTNLSDVVLFGAAYTAQGGTNHINEQPHTYWADLFSEHQYVPFDIFRPVFWADGNVEFWYRQNTFLYLRVGSAPYIEFVAKNILPMQNIAFMNCIHPELYEKKTKSVFIRGGRMLLHKISCAFR